MTTGVQVYALVYEPERKKLGRSLCQAIFQFFWIEDENLGEDLFENKAYLNEVFLRKFRFENPAMKKSEAGRAGPPARPILLFMGLGSSPR